MATEPESSKRIDFKPGVADLLYRQAGGRCSVPRCTNPTMGPFYAQEGAVNMGVACHIYSAAENGPRGWGGKDEAFIGSDANGIWCCQYHSVLIDKRKGRDYPASTLFAWKELAEARVRKQMNDSPSPLGWVETLEFTEFVRHLRLPKLQLSRCNLLLAKNGAGKSALMQIAAATSDSRHAERFLGSTVANAHGNVNPVRFSAQVTYTTVDSLSSHVKLEIGDGVLTRKVGMTPCLLPPGDVELMYCCEDSSRKHEAEDELDFFMRVLNLDKSALLALCNLTKGVLMPGEFRFVHAKEDAEDGEEERPDRKRYKVDGSPYMELEFRKQPHNFYVSYAGLSGSERNRLILDLAIAKAREVAKQRLTLLMIENLADTFDKGNFAELLTALAREPFQCLMTLPSRHEARMVVNDGQDLALAEAEYLSAWKLVTLPAPLYDSV